MQTLLQDKPQTCALVGIDSWRYRRGARGSVGYSRCQVAGGVIDRGRCAWAVRDDRGAPRYTGLGLDLPGAIGSDRTSERGSALIVR